MKAADAFIGLAARVYAHAKRGRYRRIPSLVPPPSAVPTAAEKQQYDDDDDQKGCVIHIVLLSGDDRTAGNNKCGRPILCLPRELRVQAITSQERQGAGFVDSVATDPRPPRESVAGVALFTIAVTLCFREHSYRARRIGTFTTNAPGQFRLVVAYLAERFCHG
jgi:hypothetical protein